jgi:hypothetical protein
MGERIPVPGGYLVWHDIEPVGLRFVLQTAWDDGFESALRSRDVVGMVLNAGLGWPGGSVDFLARFPGLKMLSLDRWAHKDIAALASLPQLERLNLVCQFGKFDFGSLPRLRFASVRWRPGAEDLLAQAGLEELIVDAYPHTSLAPMAALVNLRHLGLSSRQLVSLEGLRNLAGLRSLDLFDCPALVDLAALEAAESLESLQFNTCRGVRSLDAMALKRLKLEQRGTVGSVRPLAGLRNLQELFLIGVTVEDGDLSPLLSLPALRKVAFAKSRGHSHTVEQINAALASR